MGGVMLKGGYYKERDNAEREHYNESRDDAGAHYKWEG